MRNFDYSLVFFMIVISFEMLAQGYYNQENFGNRSILLSGNVTGSVDDLGLTYYNPARLALIEDPVFTINAKAYQVNSLKLTNIFGRDNKLSDDRFEGVPSLIAGTFNIEKWEKHHFAYSFLSKIRTRLNLSITNEIDIDDLGNEFDESDRVVGDFELDNKETDEWVGLSWSMGLGENLSIGVSTFVSIYNYKGVYDLTFASLTETYGVDVFKNKVEYKQSSYGIFWKIGLAWTFEKFDFGLNVDLPYVEVIGDGRIQYQRYLSGEFSDSEDFEFYDLNGLETKREEPLGISIGLGYPIGRSKLHFKADWHAALAEYERMAIPPSEYDEVGFSFKESLRSVINFGVGAEFYVNENLNLYGSFSTDFSPVESGPNIFDLVGSGERDANFDEDFLHFGFGADIKLKKMKLVLGSTYSTASGEFSEPIDFPLENTDVPVNDDPSRIRVDRWRFIVGLEIPIFGYELEFN